MTEVVKEWIAKAEGDFMTAQRELRVRKHPNYDAVCFHSQQSVEKSMKGLIILAGKEVPKIHDLVTLSDVLRALYPLWI